MLKPFGVGIFPSNPSVFDPAHLARLDLSETPT